MSVPAHMTTSQYREAVEHPGTPIRPPATAVLTVDTADRLKFDANGYAIQPSAVNNLYINTQQTVVQGYFTRIGLTELNMVWNIPNVNARNNTLTLRLYDGAGGSTDLTTDVPADGFYDPVALAGAISSSLATDVALLPAPYPARYPGITVTYNQITCSFTIQNSIAGNGFLIIPHNLGASDDLTNMMGFGAIPSTATPASTWIGGYASMQYTPYIDIVSRQLTKKQNVNDNSTSTNTGRNLLARIYLTPEDINQVPRIDPLLAPPYTTLIPSMIGCRPFTLRREFAIPKQIYWDTKEFINVIDLVLTDYKGSVLYESPTVQAGNTISLGTGNANWQLTFQITET